MLNTSEVIIHPVLSTVDKTGFQLYTYISVKLMELSSGVRIVSLQQDGLFSSESYMHYVPGIGNGPLSNFTLCTRLNLNFLRGEDNFFFSYVNDDFDDALTGAIIHHVDDNVMTVKFCQETQARGSCPAYNCVPVTLLRCSAPLFRSFASFAPLIFKSLNPLVHVGHGLRAEKRTKKFAWNMNWINLFFINGILLVWLSHFTSLPAFTSSTLMAS